MKTKNHLFNYLFSVTEVKCEKIFTSVKKIIAFVIAAFIVSYSYSQQILIKQFEKTYGGAWYERLYGMEQTADGGYILTGLTTSFGSGGSDVFLVKTDQMGNSQWTKTYGGTGNEWGIGIQQTIDGGYIVGGNTNSFGAGSNDYFLIKTDQNGDTLWTRTFGGTSSDDAYAVRQTNDGGYILTGVTSSFGVYGNAVYLVKTDANGNLQWQRTIEILTWEASHGIQQTNDGGYIITGLTYGWGNAFLLKTDSLGNKEWVKYNYFGTNFSIGKGVTQTPDGGYVFTGSVYGIGSGAFDIFLIKTNANGDTLWRKTYGGILNDFGFYLFPLADGGYLIGGETWNFGAGNSDIIFIITDENGNEIRRGTAGGPSQDGDGNASIYGSLSVIQTFDGGYAVGGTTFSFGADERDFYFVKLIELSNLTPTITGSIYNDVDSNCIFNDTIDFTVSNRTVQATDGPYFVYTDNNGNYNLRVPDGNYNVTQTTVANDIFTVLDCPNTQQVYNVTVSGSNLVPGKDFFDVLAAPSCDVSVVINPEYLSPLIAPCPGISQTYCVTFTNTGGLPISNPIFSVTVDPNVTIVSYTSDCGNTCISSGQTVTCTGNSFNPSNSSCSIYVTVQVNTSCPLPFPPTCYGITLITNASLSGTCQGNQFTSNAVPLNETVTCAVDPNDKLLVTPKGCGPFGNISGDETLTYRIRFQNTGNASAHNIVLQDVLDEELDLTTFRMIATSHPATRVELFPANTLLISFIGIELPDSTSNLIGSNGFVLFNIKPQSGLPDGTTITNEAGIYFDLNEPIITNSTLNTIRDVIQPVTLPSFSDVCINDSAYALTGGQPAGGTYSGDGVINGMFNPSVADPGTHAISYTFSTGFTENNYSLNQSGTFSPVAGEGTKVFLADDQVKGPFTVGFDFNFYGVTYSDFYISSNGFITFNTDFAANGCCFGAFLPNHSSPSNLIAVAWDDLYPPGNGYIDYFTTGTAPNRKLIVNFMNIPQCCNNIPKVTSQLILYEGSNIIEIHSTDVEVTAGTMGVVNNGGNLATVVPKRNSTFFSITNDFVQFIPPPPESECSNTAKSAITVKPLPSVTITTSGPTTFCEDDFVLLTATAAATATYLWSNGATTQSIAVSNTGEYTVTVSNLCGSNTASPITVTVKPKPTAIITDSGSTNLCPGQSVALTANMADSYLWSNGDTTQSITVLTTGDFSVTVTTNGCSAVSETVSVIVNNVPCGKDKLVICHLPPGNTNNPQTLCVNTSSLQAHIAHGDYCGPCTTSAKTSNNNDDNADWCGTNEYEYIKSLKYSLDDPCDTSYYYPCFCPATRDLFIPDNFTPIKYFTLLLVVVDTDLYGVTQENIDFMMAGVNNYFNPWKIEFCYTTEFIDSEFISSYPQNQDSIINVLIYDWSNLGLSGNPIKIDYSIVINNYYKGAIALAHELGHNFQLHHTFIGLEGPPYNNYPCSNPYRDRVDYMPFPSIQDTIGDRFSDTPPTPINYNCAPPQGVDTCSAGNPPWPAWGYENLMGYSFCPYATFSPQQMGAIHCYFFYYAALFTNALLIYGTQHCNLSATISSVSEENKLQLEIMPNPFNENTSIIFSLSYNDKATIEIYNYLGQKVAKVFEQQVINQQTYRIEFNGKHLSPGVYSVVAKTSIEMRVKRMVIMK